MTLVCSYSQTLYDGLHYYHDIGQGHRGYLLDHIKSKSLYNPSQK